jgi:hypothetical protein
VPCVGCPAITHLSFLITSTHRGLRSWCGQALPLAPSRQRDVVVQTSTTAT